MLRSDKTLKKLMVENEELRARLDEAEKTLSAIHRGEVDAPVTSTPNSDEAPSRRPVEKMDGALTLGVDGEILYANRRLTEMLKRPLENVVGASLLDYISPADQPAFSALLLNRKEDSASGEISLIAAGNEVLPVNFSLSLLCAGNIYCYFCLVTPDLAAEKRYDEIVTSERLARVNFEQSEHARRILLSILEDQKLAELALREERNLLRTVIDNLPDQVFVKDNRSHFLVNNAAHLALLDAGGQEDTQGKTDRDFFPLDLAEQYNQKDHGVIQSGRSLIDFEEPSIDRDGNAKVFLTSKVPLRDSQGRVTGLVGISRDITEFKQREREREAILTVSNAMRVYQTRAEMLPVLLDTLLGMFQAEGATLDMVDAASGDVVTELGRGPLAASFTGLRMPSGSGVSGLVIASAQSFSSKDYIHDPLFVEMNIGVELSAVACAPLIAHGHSIGALWVMRKNEFAESEVRLLAAVADIAANAIHRMILFEQTEKRLRRITALSEIDRAISSSIDIRVNLGVVAAKVVEQLGVDAADVFLFKPGLSLLEFAAGRGFWRTDLSNIQIRLGESFAGQVALDARPVFITDLNSPSNRMLQSLGMQKEKFASYYGSPLMVKGQVKGVLEVFTRKPLQPDSEWMEFMETLAGQAAIAIDNAELFDNLQRSNLELGLAYDTTLEGWANALDLRERETEGHSRRVVEYTLRLAHATGMDDREIVHVRRGALLHDIGKVGIPDHILLKPGPLTDDEWVIMRRHPEYALKLLSPIDYLRPAIDIPYCHHEKWDGTGYPRGLKGEQIPLAARLFAVVDVWDALRSNRPYRPAWPEDKAIEYISQQSGKHFDPQVVELFIKTVLED